MIFPFRDPDQRRELLAGPFPESWLSYLTENVFLYGTLSEAEQARLRNALRIFVAEKFWEGCGGLEITDEIRVTIAAWACLLVLGFDDYYFDEVQSILVYPGGYLTPTNPGQEPGGVRHLQGEAHHHGPVVLSWWNTRWDGRRPGRCHLVLHEFAHKLAELGDPRTGTPPLEEDSLRRRWQKVASREYRRLREDASYNRPTLLDPYGASNQAEFFAVATECFFLQPRRLRRQHPKLYEILTVVYHQEPAERRAANSQDAARAKESNHEYARHVIAECSAAIRLHPDYVDAYRARARFLVHEREYDRALADYSTVLQLTDNEDVEVYCDRGVVYRDKACFEEAIADFNRAIELCPTYARAYCERGLANAQRRDEDAGLADLDLALRIDPKDGITFQERGRLHCKRGEYEQAVRDFTEAMRFHPFAADLYRDRAEAHAALGHEEQANQDQARFQELEGDAAMGQGTVGPVPEGDTRSGSRSRRYSYPP